MARSSLVRTAVVALTACAALAAGAVTAGAASADPSESFAAVPGYGQAAWYNPQLGDPLGRKWK